MPTVDRIVALQQEIDALTEQRKEDKRAAKIASTWVNAEKRLPESDTMRVLAWAKDRMELCWFKGGKFYAYDGTFFLMEKDRVDDVSHWMPKDWMYSREWPAYGPGIKNRLRYYWQRIAQGTSDMTRDLRPKTWGKNAQIDKKVVYFKNDNTGEIRMGLPESFPASPGFHKVVCNSAHEAEVWSDRLRQYNSSREGKIDEQRAEIEGQYSKEIRSNIHHLMANSRSKYGKEFMQRHLERMDKAEGRMKMTREEYLHSEAYEKNH